MQTMKTFIALALRIYAQSVRCWNFW